MNKILVFFAKNDFITISFLVVLFSFLLDVIFNLKDHLMIRVGVSSFLAIVLSPRRRKLKTQTGVKTQITWFLLKEPIYIEK